MKRYTLSERLNMYLRKHNKKQADILKASKPYEKQVKTALSRAHMSHYINGRSTPDAKRLTLLAKAMEVSEVWLLGYETTEDLTPLEQKCLDHFRTLGKKEQEKFLKQFKKRTDASAESTQKKSNKSFETKEIFHKADGAYIYPHTIGAAAGVGTSQYADSDQDTIMIPEYEWYEEPEMITIYVRGKSMEPAFYDGDILWVDTADKNIGLHQVGVYETDSGYVVKKQGRDQLLSINPDYDDIDIRLSDEVSIIGKVIDVIKKSDVERWKKAKWV